MKYNTPLLQRTHRTNNKVITKQARPAGRAVDHLEHLVEGLGAEIHAVDAAQARDGKCYCQCRKARSNKQASYATLQQFHSLERERAPQADVVTDTNVGMAPDELVIDLDHSVVEGRRAGHELAHVDDNCLILLCNRHASRMSRSNYMSRSSIKQQSNATTRVFGERRDKKVPLREEFSARITHDA